MKSIYDVPAPAKLNLFLHITGRRADGYHLLQSVFMLIDWQDTLHFERRSGGQIDREDLTVALPKDDLITKAARLLQTETGCAWGAHISVQKEIPAQAGMGGGSSDAATCLLALNRLWGLGLSIQQLATVGVKLGADVPFFLHGHNAWVEGIGDKMNPLLLPHAQFVVIKPEERERAKAAERERAALEAARRYGPMVLSVVLEFLKGLFRK
jgi:4-diphosphocytidyl-2-C-methyl-D-erythritol kinase